MHKVYGEMGFNDLSVFNLTMFGKQGWKFQTELQSLVFCIFKGRYFPSRSIHQKEFIILSMVVINKYDNWKILIT